MKISKVKLEEIDQSEENEKTEENDKSEDKNDDIPLYKGNNFISTYKYSSYTNIKIFSSISFIINIILIIFIFIYLYKNKHTKKKHLYYWQEEKFEIEDYFKRMRVRYLKTEGSDYDDYNLVTFQDKINWLIIHDSTPLKARCTDKILVHEYSKEKLGKDICNKILKIYNNAYEVNFKELPNQFAIKTNHGNSYNIIVKNKANLNENAAKQVLNKWMLSDYGDYRKEFHYSFIKPKIFAEEFIGATLKNYKFLCYNGVPKYVYVSITDGGEKYRNFYDMDWNFINFHCLSQPHPTYKYSKPKFFETMKEYARKLSEDFRFVRVDLYELENEVRLGELTFTPMNSFFYCKNKKDEIELGKDIDTIIKK